MTLSISLTLAYQWSECHILFFCYAECRYAECRHAECRGALSRVCATAKIMLS